MHERDEQIMEILRGIYKEVRRGEIDSNLSSFDKVSPPLASKTVKRCIDSVLTFMRENPWK